MCTHLFRDVVDFISFDLASQIFRKFAFECFARFGIQIAKSTTGSINGEELAKRIDSRIAFEAAINGHSLTLDQRESLGVRCQKFLISSEPIYKRLKFVLTQGYYFTQLLGIENAKFNPLAEQTFANSIFYLDTNVLLTGLLQSHEEQKSFQEMVNLAKRLGIKLRVSRATLDEAKGVINDRIKQIKKIVNVIPNKLAERTNDQILKAFYEACKDNPILTPEDFFNSFKDLEAILINEWDIEIDKRTAKEIINGQDVNEVRKVMNEEAERNRGWGKSPDVVDHDVAHYLAIVDERAKNNKAWFLSKDRSFEAVSARILPNQPLFSFSHIGFLQSISPFVTSANEEISLADVMSAFMFDQIRPIETLFDIQELALMAEFHEDVMSTPADQLIMAFDYVKSRTLRGEQYKEADIPRVSLELKKFLAADKDKQMEALEQEQLRLSETARIEKELRLATEKKAEKANQSVTELQEELGLVRNQLLETQNEVSDIKNLLDNQKEFSYSKIQRERLISGIIGLLFGLCLLYFNSTLIEGFLRIFPSLSLSKNFISILALIFRIISTLVFAIPLINYILKNEWISELKTITIGLIVVLAIIFSNVISTEALSQSSNLIGIGTFIASVIVYLFLNRKK